MWSFPLARKRQARMSLAGTGAPSLVRVMTADCWGEVKVTRAGSAVTAAWATAAHRNTRAHPAARVGLSSFLFTADDPLVLAGGRKFLGAIAGGADRTLYDVSVL